MHTTFAKKIGTFWQANVKQRAIYWHILVNVCHLLNGPNFKSRTVTKQFRNCSKIFELNVLLKTKIWSLRQFKQFVIVKTILFNGHGRSWSAWIISFVCRRQNTAITVRLFDCRAVRSDLFYNTQRHWRKKLWQRKKIVYLVGAVNKVNLLKLKCFSVAQRFYGRF